MDWLENKYIGILSSRFRNYRRKSSGLINFSCPICGDSESDRKKARGYIYEKRGKSMFHCHNCGATMFLTSFVLSIKTYITNL